MEGGTGQPVEPDQARWEHDSFVAAAVVFSGMFLGSEITYQFAVAATSNDSNALPDAMRGKVREEMAALFRDERRFRRISALEKYQAVLELAGLPRIPGKRAFKNANLVIEIRNRLVHYEQGIIPARDYGGNVITPERFRAELGRRRITDNPMAAAGEPYFPRRALSHRLAEAAVKWAMAWVDQFYAKVGANPPPLDGIRDQTLTR